MIRVFLLFALLCGSAHAQPAATHAGKNPAGCSAISPPSGGIYDSTSLSGSSATAGSFTAGGVSSPDCGTNGSTFVEDTSDASHQLAVNGGAITTTLSAQSATVTIYVQQGSGTRDFYFLMYNSSFALSTGYIMNPTTGATVTAVYTNFPGATPSETVTAEPNGWWKVTMTTSVVTATGIWILCQNSEGSTTSYTGDGSSSLFYWGVGLTTP